MWRCLRDPKFNHFTTIVACDGRTDRQGNSIYCVSTASRGKNHRFMKHSGFMSLS